MIVGRGNLGAGADATVAAAASLRGPDTLFLSALRRGNVHGALDAGLAPGFLPGRVTLDAGRDWFTTRWGGVPKDRGLDAEGILRAAADGKIDVLILLGADPIADFPDATLAANALESGADRDRGRRVPLRLHATGRRLSPEHALGREVGHGREHRGARATLQPQGRARRHGNGRLAHRAGAGRAPRSRRRPGHGRRGHRRDRAQRARVRGRERGAHAQCARRRGACHCAITTTRSCCAPARCRSWPTTVPASAGTRSRPKASSPRRWPTRPMPPRWKPRRPRPSPLRMFLPFTSGPRAPRTPKSLVATRTLCDSW